jgi:hypothetical protein
LITNIDDGEPEAEAVKEGGFARERCEGGI